MHNLGEDLILGTHRIPWLIWIQLIVLLLLILLLSYFELFSLDVSPSDAVAASAVSSQSSSFRSAVLHHEAGGSEETETETETESESERGIDIIAVRGGGSSHKDFQCLFHPCFYLDLAKKAFFQCLGLGFTPPNPRDRSNEE